MPLFQEWSPNEHSLAAVWHIEEEEGFFVDRTRLNSQIKHPRRRIEHLAGRFLLQHLKEDFPLLHIAPDAHDKPRIPDDRYRFSISHSYPYVAALISDKEECGIDIQVWKDRIADIAYMFLSEEEQAVCSDSRLITLAWTAKEAAYKWWGRRGASFINDLPIESIPPEIALSALSGFSGGDIRMRCFDKEIVVNGLMHKDFTLSFYIGRRS